MKNKTVVLGIVILGVGILVGNWLPPLFRRHEAPRVSQQSPHRVMTGEVVQGLPDGAVLNASLGDRNPVGLVFVKGATGLSPGGAWEGEVLPAGRYDGYSDPSGKKIALMQYLVSK